MKQTRSALFALSIPLAIAGSFVFGRYVSSSANMPLRAERQLASNHKFWQVEAQNSLDSHDLTLPVGYSSSQKVAQNDAGGDSGSPTNSIFSSNSPLVTFQQVYDLLKENYVDRIDSDTPLAHGAVSAMVAALDEPNSRFLEASDLKAIEDQSTGVYSGIGATFTVRKKIVAGLLERQLTIIDPVIGSPAQKAGLETGDVITDIDGHWVISYDPFAAQVKLFKSLTADPVSFNHAVDATDAKIKAGYDLAKAQAILNQTSTVPLVLSIARNGKAQSVTLDVSAPTTVADVNSKTLADGNGYIKVNTFTDTSAQDFVMAFDAVKSSPGIVIDLRDCPGGSSKAVIAIAKALNPNAPLGEVAVRDSAGQIDKALGFRTRTAALSLDSSSGAPENPIVYSGHLAVLVNDGTANVAELLAAFLHDHLGARIVGDKTFGDGMEQTLYPMNDGSAFILTTGIVKTSANVELEATGITPDISLARADTDSDVGLQKAEQSLSLTPLTASQPMVVTGQQKS